MLKLTVAAALLVATSTLVFAQEFPTKTVRVVVGNTPAEFGEFVSKELKKWDYVIKTSGIRAPTDAALK